MEQKQSHPSPLGNGFLLGIIIGALITLFLVTKKGRVLLKRLSDEGLDIFEELEEILKKAEGTVTDTVEKQKEVITEKASEVKEVVTKSIEKKMPEITEKVTEIKKEIAEVATSAPLTEIKEKLEEVQELVVSTIEEVPDVINEKIAEVQTIPEVKHVEETVEKTVEQIVEQMEAAQSELQTVKEELKEALHVEKPKSPIKRFFKGIKKK